MDRGATIAEAAISTSTATAHAGAVAAVAGRRSKLRRTRTPTVLTLSDVGDAHGVLDVPSAASARRAFPRAARALGSDVVAAVAAVSRLVGMECPGRDSVLSALRLALM